MFLRLAVIGLLAALSCGGAGAPPPGDAVTATAERDGVRVTLTLTHRVLSPGQVVWADVQIRNTNAHAVRWVGGGCNFPAHISARLPTGGFGRSEPGPIGEWKKRWLRPPRSPSDSVFFIPEVAWEDYPQGGSGPICTADIRINELAPQGTLAMRAAWDGLVLGPDGRHPAPNGVSEVSAVFPMGEDMVRKDVVAKVTIALTGGPTVVSGGEAIDAALADPRFRSWLEERLAAERPDQPVEGSLRLEGDRWRIVAAQKVIEAGILVGHEADAVVDAKMAKLLTPELRRRS